MIGNDEECVLIDAPHDAAAILAAIGDQRLVAILLTHAHDDHVGAALDVGDATEAEIWLHPADRALWDCTHPNRAPSREIEPGQRFTVGGADGVTRRVRRVAGTWCAANTGRRPRRAGSPRPALALPVPPAMRRPGPAHRPAGRARTDFRNELVEERSELLPGVAPQVESAPWPLVTDRANSAASSIEPNTAVAPNRTAASRFRDTGSTAIT
ncbi:beta-lactamase domain protein [Parafrankia sp. EAN1pec]|nr:beta-lactamase domain protein [Frankia sp. EAN1pec]